MLRISRTFSILIAAVLLLSVGCAKPEEPVAQEPEPPPPVVEAPAPLVAVAELQSTADLSITGMVSFTQTEAGVAIMAHIEGAPPGPHGLHVHEMGDCSAEDFKSAGGHFNPTGAPHGAPTDTERHAGDLGNMEIGEDGGGHFELDSDLLTVEEGPNSVVGRGVILHEKADDLVSQPTGAAGARLACGVVEASG
jgi:Cu-Zn family superoxide dismutase